MSPQASDPSPDVYVGLLFIAVAALATGCVLLWKVLGEYQFQLAP